MTRRLSLPALAFALLTAAAASGHAGDRQGGMGLPAWRTTVSPTPGAARATAAPAAIPAWGPATVRMTTGALPPARPAARPSLAGTNHLASGIASYYWQEQKTASGERFDKTAMTAAHPTLPFNTRVKVTHVDSGRTVVVRINDRGPFKPGRVIDLSYAAAGVLGIRDKGLARVRLDVVR